MIVYNDKEAIRFETDGWACFCAGTALYNFQYLYDNSDKIVRGIDWLNKHHAYQIKIEAVEGSMLKGFLRHQAKNGSFHLADVYKDGVSNTLFEEMKGVTSFQLEAATSTGPYVFDCAVHISEPYLNGNSGNMVRHMHIIMQNEQAYEDAREPDDEDNL